MAAIYARWIKMGRLTLDDVPSRWQDTVHALLTAEGVDQHDNR